MFFHLFLFLQSVILMILFLDLVHDHAFPGSWQGQQMRVSSKQQETTLLRKLKPCFVSYRRSTIWFLTRILSIAAILLLTSRRAQYLQRALTALLNHHPVTSSITPFQKIDIPIIISQDGNDLEVMRVAKKFCSSIFPSKGISCHYIQNFSQGDDSFNQKKMYERISNHYKFSLDHSFSTLFEKSQLSEPKQIVILEEDLLIAKDFFEYFVSMIPLLESDETLLSVSAWNDNGQIGLVKDARRLLRTDFFPGLGWMLHRRTWNDIRSQWPSIYWDDWLRHYSIKRGFQSIRPEISRTYHIGIEGGASGSSNRKTMLTNIKLNDEYVPWSKTDLSYLAPSQFFENYMQKVNNAKEETSLVVALQVVKNRNTRLIYTSADDFANIARKLNVWQDKRGSYRTAYRSIIELRPFGKYLLYIVPK